jgi:hypothetical protein
MFNMISWRRPSRGVATVFCLFLVYLLDVGRTRGGLYGGARDEKEVGRRDLKGDVRNETLGVSFSANTLFVRP